MFENLFVLFVLVPVLAVVLALGGAALVEWAKPVSKKRSVALAYTREARVSEAKRAAESDARWERLVKYSHWLEDSNPICRMHEKSYERMLVQMRRAAWVRMIHDPAEDELVVRNRMLNLKCANPEEFTRIVEMVLG